MNRIEQIAREGYWLCTDITSDDCLFAKRILRSPDAPAWAECTNLEREEFERTHPAPEPPENE